MGTLCIVGGSGFVGGHLLNRWSGQHTIKVLSRHCDGSALARVAPGSLHYAIDVYDPAKWCASSRTSAGRSRSGGIRSTTTSRRK